MGGNNLNDEGGELYLFIAELVDDTTVGSAGVKTVSSVNVVCHPASSVKQDDFSTVDEQEGENIYGATDDSGREYIKEVVDELFGLPISTQDHVAEGVWSVYTVPKLNEAGNDLEPDTLNDHLNSVISGYLVRWV